MKSNLSFSLIVLVIAGFAVSSCSKTNDLKAPTTLTQAGSGKGGGGGTGGGGTGGGGTGGGGTGGGGTPALPTDTVSSPLPIEDIVTTGTWRVVSYVEGTENSTKQFANDSFTFMSDGTLIADNKGDTTYGYWRNVVAVFYYGIPIYGSNPAGFNISIGATNPLLLLSKDLFVSKKTASSFYLDSVNPAEDSHVIFVRI